MMLMIMELVVIDKWEQSRSPVVRGLKLVGPEITSYPVLWDSSWSGIPTAGAWSPTGGVFTNNEFDSSKEEVSLKKEKIEMVNAICTNF